MLLLHTCNLYMWVMQIALFHTGHANRMEGGKLLVDGQLCYIFPNSTDNLPEKIDVTCSLPLTGQMVKFQRHGVRDNWDSYLINICEVQVWGKYSRTSSK